MYAGKMLRGRHTRGFPLLSRTAKWFRVFEATFLGLTQKLEYERTGRLLPWCQDFMLGKSVLLLCYQEIFLLKVLLEQEVVS